MESNHANNTDSINNNKLNAGIDIYVGQKFSSYLELKEHVEKYQVAVKQRFHKKRSRTIRTAEKSLRKSFKQSLQFYEIEYGCVHGTLRPKRGNGLRRTSTLRMGCEANFKLRVCPSGEFLEIRSTNLNHNRHNHALKKPRLKDHVVPYIWPYCPPSKETAELTASIKLENDLSSSSTTECSELVAVAGEKATEENVILDKGNYSSVYVLEHHGACVCKIEHNVFHLLWSKEVALTLPSSSAPWTVHYLSNDNGDKLIALLQTVLIQNDAVVLKKMLITESSNTIKCYIFQHLHSSSTVKQTDVHSLSKIQDILQDFDGIYVCLGVSDAELPHDFSSPLYRRDAFSKSWRHNDCKFSVLHQAGEEAAAALPLGGKCTLCQNIQYFGKKVTNNTVSRKKLFPKRVATNRRRRESRLRHKLEMIERELMETRERMNNQVGVIEELFVEEN